MFQRYEKPVCNPHSALKQHKHFDHCQQAAFVELYKWRDSVARELDESVGSIMPDQNLLQLAEKLPKNKADIVRHWKNQLCSDPNPKYLEKVKTILLQARHAPEHEVR